MVTHHHLKLARHFTDIMENRFSILGIRFGIDVILGLIPGIGDILSMLLSLYLIWIGWSMKVPSTYLMKMTLYIGIDLLLGSIPVLGDVSDVFYRANNKNLALLEKFAREKMS